MNGLPRDLTRTTAFYFQGRLQRQVLPFLTPAGRDARATRRSTQSASCPPASAPRSNHRNRANRPCRRRRPISAPSPPAVSVRGRRRALASLKVVGDRGAAPLRRHIAGPSPVRFRPGIVERCRWRLGGSGGGSRRVGAKVGRQKIRRQRFEVRACARSRSLRDVEENSRLRFGLAARSLGRRSVSRRSARRGLILPRRRRRRRRCGGSVLPALSAACGLERETGIASGAPSRVRPGGSTGRTVTSPRVCGTPAEPSRDNLQFPDRQPKPEHHHAGANPGHAALISVLPTLNSLTEIPIADRQQARQNKAQSGNQHANHHRTNPPAAPEMLADRHCHDTVIMCASPTDNCTQGSSKNSSRGEDCLAVPAHSAFVQPGPYIYVLPKSADLLRCIRELGHN